MNPFKKALPLLAVFGFLLGSAFAKMEKMPEVGLPVGSKAPAFSLKSSEGAVHSLGSYLKKGPLVLVFYRGGWCPYCNKHLKEIQGALKDFKAAGASVAAISVDLPNREKGTSKTNQLGFDLLSDPSAEVIKNYHLVNQVDEGTKKKYKQFGIDLSQHSGQKHGIIAVPGVVVVDKKGIIRFFEANTDYTKRPSPAIILKALTATTP